MGSSLKRHVEARGFQRFPTNIAATMVFERVEHAVRIRDISALGCCLAVDNDLAKGDEIVLLVRGLEVVATVAWAQPSLIGANFHTEIDPLRIVRDNSDLFTRRRRANAMMNPAG